MSPLKEFSSLNVKHEEHTGTFLSQFLTLTTAQSQLLKLLTSVFL